MKPITLLSLSILTLSPQAIFAQNRIGTGKVVELYQQNCANCHGQNLEGGSAATLTDAQWNIKATDSAIARVIKSGNENLGMPAFGETLSDQEIRSLVILIREEAQINKKLNLPEAQKDEEITTEHYKIRIEEVATIDGTLWGMDFLPNGDIITTEKNGDLWIHNAEGFSTPIDGTPRVKNKGQGGLLDIAIHPNYETNSWIYLSFSEESPSGDSMTSIVRGKIESGKWTDQETIYSADKTFFTSRSHHFGSRIVFQEDYIFFSIGDRGQQDLAQDITTPNGKIHRLHADGKMPQDNPFVGTENAIESIWTFGNRNPQGLAFHPETGDLWEAEHGPRGGDEINRITAHTNYGWPVITYGMNYNGSPITDITKKEGMAQPKHYWVPSIAVCGIDFYSGEKFPEWENNLFAGGLASGELHRLKIENANVIKSEIIFKSQGRIRDVTNGPDGNLYLISNRREPESSSILRITEASN